MSFSNVMELLDAGSSPPPAVRRVVMLHVEGNPLDQDTYDRATNDLRAVGWWLDDEPLEDYTGCLCAPEGVEGRCEAHPDWEQFVETWGREEDLVDKSHLGDHNADVVFFCALYMFAHERGLL